MPDKPVDTNLYLPMVKEDWRRLEEILRVFFNNSNYCVSDEDDRKGIVFAQYLKETVDSKLDEFKEESDELRRD